MPRLRSNIPLPWVLGAVGVAVVVCSLVLTFLATRTSSANPTHSQPTASGVSYTTNSGVPERLTIPKIMVDAAIEQVGLSGGEVGVPSGPTNAAWFNLSPRPGDKGVSVIDGHYGWKDGIPAVFDSLSKLQKGDKVFVQDEKGDTVTFVVRGARTYRTDEDSSSVFYSSDGKAHLVLITCGGVWEKALKSYSERIVVLADKE